jgi:hypothetical protein
MRTSRRFSPSLETMSARIAPSTVVPVASGTLLSPGAPVVVTMDDAPTTPSTGEGTLPIVPDPTGTSTGTVC